jgi:hypothetical protein
VRAESSDRASQATNRKNRPKHRLRILQAIQRIGGLSNFVSYADFYTLVRDPNPAMAI